jgi:hypothetical protein
MNDLVEVVNNQAVVSSRQVAEHFGKEHRFVIFWQPKIRQPNFTMKLHLKIVVKNILCI